MKEERADLAGGCFWGMQDLIRRQYAVIAARVGYSAGDVPNATYRNHSYHAPTREITDEEEDKTKSKMRVSPYETDARAPAVGEAVAIRPSQSCVRFSRWAVQPN